MEYFPVECFLTEDSQTEMLGLGEQSVAPRAVPGSIMAAWVGMFRANVPDQQGRTGNPQFQPSLKPSPSTWIEGSMRNAVDKHQSEAERSDNGDPSPCSIKLPPSAFARQEPPFPAPHRALPFPGGQSGEFLV